MALNKMQKRNWIIGISAFLVVSLILIVFLNVVDTSDSQALAIGDLDTDVGKCSGGFTSFSIDRVTINADKSRIRVFGVAKGSECLRIQLTPNQINQELSGKGVQATKTITGEVRLKEYTKTFPIDRTKDGFNNDIFYKSIQIGTFNTITSLDFCTTNNCKKNVNSNSVANFQTGLVGQTCNCVYPGGQGIAGDFSGSRSFGNFKVDFKLDGRTATLSREQQSVNIGNHHIEWVGNLLNLDQITSPQFDARLLISKWELVNDGALSEVNSEFNNFVSCYETRRNFRPAQIAFNDCKADFDSRSNSILSEKLQLYKSINSALISDADTDLNNLYVTLKAPPYPAFILDLDAEDVGIIALEGKPDITSCIDDQELTSGKNKVVTFSVRNNANANNVEFFSSINCDKGAVGFIPNFNIGAHQERTISSELQPSNPNEGTLSGNCELKVNDLKSGDSDSCRFGISVEFESGIICEPGSLSCSSDFSDLLRCKADGKGQVIEKECEFGCEITSSGAKCRGQLPPPTSGKCNSCDDFVRSKLLGWAFPSQKCEGSIIPQPPFILSNTTCSLSFVKVFLVPIILLFALIFSFNVFQTSRKLKIKNKGISFLVALVIGLILAVLTWFLFWFGIILFSILVIFWIILKAIL